MAPEDEDVGAPPAVDAPPAFFAAAPPAPGPPPVAAPAVEPVSEPSGLEPAAAPELELAEVSELELSEDPPPHPVSTSAATTSARRALALVVFAGLARRR
ncbi:MAG TPA: hypothetical protein VFS48_03300 [Solirubrobacterales bacterium]|nr:hypothetical protein [Solirubrobacterales bacterium]